MDKQTDMGNHCGMTCCNNDKPLMEFMIPESEVDQEVTVGDVGSMVIPVVIVAKTNGMVTFRKTDNVKADGGFRPETIDEMRKRIIDEQEESAETPEEEATEDETKE